MEEGLGKLNITKCEARAKKKVRMEQRKKLQSHVEGEGIIIIIIIDKYNYFCWTIIAVLDQSYHLVNWITSE